MIEQNTMGYTQYLNIYLIEKEHLLYLETNRNTCNKRSHLIFSPPHTNSYLRYLQQQQYKLPYFRQAARESNLAPIFMPLYHNLQAFSLDINVQFCTKMFIFHLVQ